MTTKTSLASKPESDEYAPYYEKYISLVPDGDILSHPGEAGAANRSAAFCASGSKRETSATLRESGV